MRKNIGKIEREEANWVHHDVKVMKASFLSVDATNALIARKNSIYSQQTNNRRSDLSISNIPYPMKFYYSH